MTSIAQGSGALTSMVVREVDLSSEMPLLIDVFNRGFRMDMGLDRFNWLYHRNPDGRSTAWFVVNDRTGEVAGCTAVFPRRIQVGSDGKELVAWNCGDFCIMPRYRTGAAAVRLRRAAREGIDAGVAPFLYAHPNDRMLQIHLRVGHQPLGRMIRLARPTALSAGRPLAGIGTVMLRAARPDRFAPRDNYEVMRGPLSPEFDELFDRTRFSIGTALVRDVRYLSWRFLDCPLNDYRFVLARRRSELTGYLAFCVAGGQLHVKDWLGVDARAVRTLFSAAIDQACVAEVTSASVTLLETHRDVRLVRSLGFGKRPETSTVITYAAAGMPWHAAVASADAWYMTVGDRDV